ncbi:MAG: IPT/TIG domain-containing protein [Actinomycetota bacterium]
MVIDQTGARSQVLGAWTSNPDMKFTNFRSAVLLEGPGCGNNCGKVFTDNGGWWGSSPAGAQSFDPQTGTWTPTAQLPEDHPGHLDGMFSLLRPPGCEPHCGKVLAVGGQDNRPGAPTSTTRAADLYDPATDTWQPTNPMLWAVAHGSSTTLPDGRVLVLGDAESGDVSDKIRAQTFSPATEAWTRTDDSNVPFVGGWTATVLEGPGCGNNCGKVLVAGNLDARLPDAVTQLFDPTAPGLDFPGQKGRWVTTGSMNIPRKDHAAALLPDGRVLAAGGHNGLVNNSTALPTDAAEIYDPHTEQWTLTGQMAIPRATGTLPGLTLTPIRCGALAAGGVVSGKPVPETELYVPDAANGAGVWTASAPMNTSRGVHSATLLDDGKVLVAGGLTDRLRGGSVATMTSEVYSPPDVCGLAEILDEVTAPTARTPVVTRVEPSSGPTAGGTAVTISGTNFTGATSVRFGADEATGIAVVSDGRITAVTPAHDPGVVDVTVKGPYGVSAVTPFDRFSYEAPVSGRPGPEVLSVDPRSGPVAGGTSVALTGKNFDRAEVVYFDTVAVTARCNGSGGSGTAACFDQPASDRIVVFSPAASGPGRVHVSVETPDGASPKTEADVFEYISSAPPLKDEGALSASAPAANAGSPFGGGTLLTPAGPGGLSSASAGSAGGHSVSSTAVGQPLVSPVPVAQPAGAPVQAGNQAAIPGFGVAPEKGQAGAAPGLGSSYNMVGGRREEAVYPVLLVAAALGLSALGMAGQRRCGRRFRTDDRPAAAPGFGY